MLRLKDCPKCKGDVQLDRDHYGWYEQCLQCGHIRDLPNIAEVKQQPVEEKNVKTSNLKGGPDYQNRS